MSDYDPDSLGLDESSLLPRAGRELGKVLKFPSELAPLHDEYAFLWELGWSVTPKLDGNRCLIINGKAYTASMRPFRNEKVQELLRPLLERSANDHMFFDAEIYDAHGEYHAELSGALNSYADPLPNTTVVAVFDGGKQHWYDDQSVGVAYYQRMEWLEGYLDPSTIRFLFGGSVHILMQRVPILTAAEGMKLFEDYVESGFEGAIVRSDRILFDRRGNPIGGWYKHGRATARQQIGFKMKQFVTFDGIIRDVIQGRRLDPAKLISADRARNPDGTLSRNGLQDFYTTDDTIGAFVVEYIPATGAQPVRTEIGFARGFDDKDRRKLWKQREQLVGRWCEFKAMTHGAKVGGGARHGRLVKFRPDKDGQTLTENEA